MIDDLPDVYILVNMSASRAKAFKEICADCLNSLQSMY